MEDPLAAVVFSSPLRSQSLPLPQSLSQSLSLTLSLSLSLSLSYSSFLPAIFLLSSCYLPAFFLLSFCFLLPLACGLLPLSRVKESLLSRGFERFRAIKCSVPFFRVRSGGLQQTCFPFLTRRLRPAPFFFPARSDCFSA